MLIGCGDCISTGSCDVKVLTAAILPKADADGTGSYCPGTYDCTPLMTGGNCVTTCSAVLNMVNWINGQWNNFQKDTDYAWNTYTTAVFDDDTSASPSSVNTRTFALYGGTVYGSNYTADYPLVAAEGSSAGSICAYAQVVAFRMTGQLFITPVDVTGKTESCLAAGSSGSHCSAGGGLSGSGVYYIPMPAYDLCGELSYCEPNCTGYEVAYQPYQNGNNVDCLPQYPGGAYTTCESPDPFFGSNPP
jgi:hypothetical protein